MGRAVESRDWQSKIIDGAKALVAPAIVVLWSYRP
jgi:hypothetical protein